MSTNHIKKQISNTAITLVPTGYRAYGLKTWRAMLVNGDDLRTGFQVASVSQMDSGEFLPESMERLRLNVLSLEENDMAWGVYHRAPRADVEAPFGTGAVPKDGQITPHLRPECVLTPGARIDHYQNQRDSLFLEIPMGMGESHSCYQVLDPRWIISMVGLLNAQRKLIASRLKREMVLEVAFMDSAIEDEATRLMSDEGAPELLAAVVNAASWPSAPMTAAQIVQEAGIAAQELQAYTRQVYASAQQAFKSNRTSPCWAHAATEG